MAIKKAITLAVSTLAFLTALGALSPLALLMGMFAGVSGIWAALRMPPFWRYTRQRPSPELLAGTYALRSNFPHHEEFVLDLHADGTFYARRFPLFTVFEPIQIEHALSGYGQWTVEQHGRSEWMLTLIMNHSTPVYVPGQPESMKGGPDIRQMSASFRLCRRGGRFALMTWIGGLLRGRAVEFEQLLVPASAAVDSAVSSGIDY
jgi:hypothetical protein